MTSPKIVAHRAIDLVKVDDRRRGPLDLNRAVERDWNRSQQNQAARRRQSVERRGMRRDAFIEILLAVPHVLRGVEDAIDVPTSKLSLVAHRCAASRNGAVHSRRGNPRVTSGFGTPSSANRHRSSISSRAAPKRAARCLPRGIHSKWPLASEAANPGCKWPVGTP